MKLVHVVESFGGGVYSFLKDLCNNQVAEHEVILIYSKREQTPNNFQDDFNRNIKLINIRMRREISLKNDFISLFKIYKLLKEIRPDIIHLHSSKAGVLGRLAALLLNYDDNVVFYNPHGYGYLQKDISRFKKTIYFYIEKVMAKVKGTIIAVSKGEYEQSKKLTKKVLRIDNAINTNEIKKLVKEKDKNRNVRIGTVGRISYQKNPSLFNEIAKSFPNYEFIWIGDGELHNDLTCKNITITGWLDRKSVIELLNNIDIYIQSSLWEGLPIALLEAMYMKKPVLVTNVIGNSDVVENNINGFICTNVEEFNYYIRSLLNDSQLFDRISKNAFDFIINNHAIEDMIENYNQAYNNTLIIK